VVGEALYKMRVHGSPFRIGSNIAPQLSAANRTEMWTTLLCRFAGKTLNIVTTATNKNSGNFVAETTNADPRRAGAAGNVQARPATGTGRGVVPIMVPRSDRRSADSAPRSRGLEKLARMPEKLHHDRHSPRRRVRQLPRQTFMCGLHQPVTKSIASRMSSSALS
jgi:hypothetical protein